MSAPRSFFVTVEDRDGGRTTWVQKASTPAAAPVAATHAFGRDTGRPLETVKRVRCSEL